jgi:hypothetical protein
LEKKELAFVVPIFLKKTKMNERASGLPLFQDRRHFVVKKMSLENDT